MTKAEYETQVQQLVGHRVVDVRYHECLYIDEDGSLLTGSLWNKNREFDSLDHGMDLEFSDGSMCHVTWGDEFEQYGLSIKWTPQRYVDTIRIWQVAQESRWRPLLNQRIVSAGMYWSWWQEQNDPKRLYYPQSLQLTFENSAQVFLSALEIRDDGSRMGGTDHITVFFERKAAVEFDAWPGEVASPRDVM